MTNEQADLPVALVGDDHEVPCVGGSFRRYLNLDAAASTSAMPGVAARVNEFLPWYSSVHRGAGFKSRESTNAYELARADVVVTTVVEHHANLLPWSRFGRPRFVECGTAGMFETGDVVAALD